MGSVSVGARKDLTDRQWVAMQRVWPPRPVVGRRPKWTRRQLLNGIRWRVRVGARWRDVPERYGHWQSIYQLFRRWQREGVWPWSLSALRAWADQAGLIDWQVSVDSTINRAHQHAAGARRRPGKQVEPPGDEPADHALDRSRGGFPTKIHLACEQGRKPLSLLIIAGQRADSPQMVAVLESIRVARSGRGRPRTRPDRVLAWPTFSTNSPPLCAAESSTSCGARPITTLRSWIARPVWAQSPRSSTTTTELPRRIRRRTRTTWSTPTTSAPRCSRSPEM
ncbi:IS5 family transposase [Saccharopolyspora sp. NPDC049357]|uniref:IS5 family transposase n=1 Tax=Saccharopolyspora sp. NPDC049357 TaxID=3154507 RepID=UPI00341CB4EC